MILGVMSAFRFVLATTLFWFGVVGQRMARVPAKERHVLERRMRHSHIPHVALAVFAHGAARFLYAGTEPKQTLNPDAVFEAASLSKPVFAAAVLSLV